MKTINYMVSPSNTTILPVDYNTIGARLKKVVIELFWLIAILEIGAY
jgi:hypothetical protein